MNNKCGVTDEGCKENANGEENECNGLRDIDEFEEEDCNIEEMESTGAYRVTVITSSLKGCDNSNGASLVLKTPIFEKITACVMKIQEEKEYGVLGIREEKIDGSDDDVKENDNREALIDSGYGVDESKTSD